MKPASILYYFPERQIPEHLKDRFKLKTSIPTSPGPDKQSSGMLISPESNVLVAFSDIDYKWSLIDGEWIGIHKDGINPELFLREERVFAASGYPVHLEDGNQYLIPVALLSAPNFSMPVVDMKGPDGKIFQEVHDRYKDITDLADTVWSQLNEKGELNIDDDEARQVCIEAIQVYYNLTENEIFALRLLSQQSYQSIFEALIDRPGLRELHESEQRKKKANGPQPVNGG